MRLVSDRIKLYRVVRTHGIDIGILSFINVGLVGDKLVIIMEAIHDRRTFLVELGFTFSIFALLISFRHTTALVNLGKVSTISKLSSKL